MRERLLHHGSSLPSVVVTTIEQVYVRISTSPYGMQLTPGTLGRLQHHIRACMKSAAVDEHDASERE